jgi:hypothetical protein
MTTLIPGLIGLAALFIFGVCRGVREAIACNRMQHKLIRDDAVMREAEKAERGIYARWFL